MSTQKAAQTISLEELCRQIDATQGKKIPTRKYLLEHGTVFIEKALNNGLLKVFDNGFVLYESMGRHTVLRADLTWETFRNNYRKYGGADDSVNWTVPLVLEGESRLAKNLEIENNRHEVPSDVMEDISSNESMEDKITEKIFCQDFLKQLLPALSELQRNIIIEYTVGERKQSDIAARYGVTKSYVSKIIKEKLKK